MNSKEYAISKENSIINDFYDITEEWFKNVIPNIHEVIDLQEYVVGTVI